MNGSISGIKVGIHRCINGDKKVMKKNRFMFISGLLLILGTVFVISFGGLISSLLFREKIDEILAANQEYQPIVLIVGIGTAVLIPIIGTLLIIGSILIPLFSGMREQSRILEHGQSAEARILALKDTGTRINENPLVDISVEVRPSNSPAFTAQIRQTISIVNLPSYQPGSIVNVKFVPGTDQVAIAGLKTGQARFISDAEL